MDPEEILRFSDASVGLEAVLVIDSTTLGPAAGGIRTRGYESREAAEADARALARAMTLKCALSGLDAGGAKAVVMPQPGWQRDKAFERLGEEIQKLGGRFRTAGDLGTAKEDLLNVAKSCEYVHTDEEGLSASVAQGLLACVKAISRVSERPLHTLSAAVQGCGAIGSAVATTLANHDLRLKLADIDEVACYRLADELLAGRAGADEILRADVDLLAPCAVGGVITRELLSSMKAWAICGAANNLVASPEVDRDLCRRSIYYVPDVIASAGAVVDGIGKTVMGLDHRGALIEALGGTAERILRQSRDQIRPAIEVAAEIAAERLGARLELL